MDLDNLGGKFVEILEVVALPLNVFKHSDKLIVGVISLEDFIGLL